MKAHLAKFSVGQLIVHKLFSYRGIIFDVDPAFQGSDEWYEQVALSRPPKDEPWYRILVHNAIHDTYVAERNIIADITDEHINHPLIEDLFQQCEDGSYLARHRNN
ncbi:MAG: heat shock protein HspQ [Gammaproteobacteria bacterium]|jgi:heat shock protein HspQ